MIMWAASNRKSPREVWKHSSERVELFCGGCNRMYRQRAMRVPLNDCVLCRNVPAHRMYNELVRHMPSVHYKPRFQWLPSCKYDFLVGHNVLIEIDAPGRFTTARIRGREFNACLQDKMKEDYALRNGMSLIRILQQDVLNDSMDWRTYIAREIFECCLLKTPVIVVPNRAEYTAGTYKALRRHDIGASRLHFDV